MGGDSGVSSAAVNDRDGTISVSVRATNQNGYAAGGVGFLFQPPRNMAIYIEPLMTYNFNWLDLANLVNASCSAFFATRVQAFDASAKFLNNIDFTYPLWNDTAGWVDEHSNSGTRATINVSSTISVIGGYYYNVWFWFNISCANGFLTLVRLRLASIMSSYTRPNETKTGLLEMMDGSVQSLVQIDDLIERLISSNNSTFQTLGQSYSPHLDCKTWDCCSEFISRKAPRRTTPNHA